MSKNKKNILVISLIFIALLTTIGSIIYFGLNNAGFSKIPDEVTEALNLAITNNKQCYNDKSKHVAVIFKNFDNAKNLIYEQRMRNESLSAAEEFASGIKSFLKKTNGFNDYTIETVTNISTNLIDIIIITKK